MKKTIFTIAAAALILGFASCSKEIENNNIPVIDEGTPTFMGIAFTVPANDKPGTRATTDDNATEAEAAFKFVDVFIYNPATGSQVKHARIPSSEFTGPVAGAGSDDWTMQTSAKIATTTGPKTIILGVNLSSTLSNALEGVNMGAFTNVAQTVSINDVTSSSDGFAMFSVEPLTVTLDIDPANNHPKVRVQRLVSKVTVQKSQNMSITASGSIDNLMFVLNNTNKKSFYVQPSDKKDHNWDVTPIGDLYDGNSDYVSINEYGVAVKSLNPKYALENTTRDFLMGQITRATVRGTFIPAEIKVFANGTSNADGYEDQAVTATTAATFYSVVYNNGADRAYFFVENIATAFAADKGATVVTYNSGYCYWDIFLNPDNVSGPYDVYRNDFYLCNITKIIGPGRNTPEVTDPTIPPAQPTDLLVDIEMVYWNPIVKDYILEP